MILACKKGQAQAWDRLVNKVVRGGEADTLCRLVAARVAQADEQRFAGVTTVQVVLGRYRLNDYFAEKRESVWERMEASRTGERVEASCPVERGRRAHRRAHLRAVEDLA